MTSIAVLVALGRNPVSGSARPNRDDLLAIELAQRLGRVRLLHAGAVEESALADYLAYTTSPLEIVRIGTGEDVAAALAPHLAGVDLILTGSRAEGGEGSGMVPYLVAERLGLPVVGQALEVSLVAGFAEVTQMLAKGRRRLVKVALPAVIAVHPMAAVKPRYAYARRVSGQILRLPDADGPGVDAPLWRIEPAGRRPVKFKAMERKAGHARMLSAIESEAKGGIVVDTGTAGDKAQAILGYLREHKLIDW